MKLSDKLVNLRAQKGLSQDELAEKIGVSAQTISKWELGISTPETDKLTQIAKVFNISVDSLLSVENSNSSNENRNINAEFVGIDSKYIPESEKRKNNESYIKEDKVARKIGKAYIIFIIALMFLMFIPMIIAMIRMESRF